MKDNIRIETKKQEKGITLIALVITIIILLILAGVSIAVLTGNNGILNQAGTAKEETNRKGAKEELQLEASGSFDDDGKYNVDKAIENLENNLNIEDEKITNNNGVLTVEYKESKFYIDTKGNVTEGITSGIIASNPTEYYGKIITNYECENKDAVQEWQIFYADDENIYLITGNSMTNTYVPDGKNGTPIGVGSINTSLYLSPYQDYTGSEDILKNSKVAKWLSWLKEYPESTNDNIRAVAYLLDIEAWKKFKGDKADYAIGAPTLDLFVSSYNQKHPEKKLEYTMNYGINGYRAKFIDDESYSSLKTGLETDSGLYNVGFLASPYNPSNWKPTSVGYVSKGTISCTNTGTSIFIRPVVCLKSDVELNELEDGLYEIK